MTQHILLCPPGREFKVGEVLTRLGYEVKIPLDYRWQDPRRIAKGTKGAAEKIAKAYPLWPRYLPVAAIGGKSWDWYEVRDARLSDGSRAAAGVLSVDGRPWQVDAITRLRIGQLASAEPPRYIEPGPNLAPGDRVRIDSGPFAGMIAKVKAIRSERAALALETVTLFRSLREITIPVESLAIVSKAA